jgi:hypothetical protein
VKRLSLAFASVLIVLLSPSQGAAAAVCDGTLTVAPQVALEWPGGVSQIGSSPEAGAWAAGLRPDPNDQYGFIATSERWSGSEWVEVPMARPLTFEPRGFAVLGDRVFAAGYHSLRRGGAAGSMIQMWDGTRWQVSPTPDVFTKTSTNVWTVGGSGPDDVWAAGRILRKGSVKLLVLHFDGAAWTRSPAPMPWDLPPDGDIKVRSIAAASSGDAWIIGSGYPFGEQSFALHWDGGSWHVENPVVADFPDNNGLYDVASTGGRTWAVGFSNTKALIIRWDGSSWHRLQRPKTGYSTNNYGTVSIGNHVLIGGSAYNGFPPDPHLAYFERVAGGWAPLSAAADGLGSLDIDADGQILGTGGQGGLGNPSTILMGCLS